MNLMWKNLQHQQEILNYLLEIVKTQITRIIFLKGRENFMKYFLMKKNVYNVKSKKKKKMVESLEKENAKNLQLFEETKKSYCRKRRKK